MLQTFLFFVITLGAAASNVAAEPTTNTDPTTSQQVAKKQTAAKKTTAPQADVKTKTKAISVSPFRHVAGGLLAAFPGFGLGHAVQGRWWSEGKGWIYTLTQLPLLPAVISHTYAIDKCEQRADEREKEGGSWSCKSPSTETFIIVSAMMFVISRIIEIFDVWDIDPDFQQVVEHQKQKSLLVLPYADTRSFGLQLAFSY